MKIAINQEKCIGCGFCRERLPSIFFLDGYTARLTETGANIDERNEILIKQLRNAAEICPAETIEIEAYNSEDTRVDSQEKPALKA